MYEESEEETIWPITSGGSQKVISSSWKTKYTILELDGWFERFKRV